MILLIASLSFLPVELLQDLFGVVGVFTLFATVSSLLCLILLFISDSVQKRLSRLFWPLIIPLYLCLWIIYLFRNNNIFEHDTVIALGGGVSGILLLGAIHLFFDRFAPNFRNVY